MTATFHGYVTEIDDEDDHGDEEEIDHEYAHGYVPEIDDDDGHAGSPNVPVTVIVIDLRESSSSP